MTFIYFFCYATELCVVITMCHTGTTLSKMEDSDKFSQKKLKLFSVVDFLVS